MAGGAAAASDGPPVPSAAMWGAHGCLDAAIARSWALAAWIPAAHGLSASKGGALMATGARPPHGKHT